MNPEEMVTMHCPVCRVQFQVQDRFSRPLHPNGMGPNCTDCLMQRKRVVALVRGRAPRPEHN